MRKILVLTAAVAMLFGLAPGVSQASHCTALRAVYLRGLVAPDGSTGLWTDLGGVGCTGNQHVADTNYIAPSVTVVQYLAPGGVSDPDYKPTGTYQIGTASAKPLSFNWVNTSYRSQEITLPTTALGISGTITLYPRGDIGGGKKTYTLKYSRLA
ncbi:MAG TPA: hypothetical protein VM600_02405 [Actinomycetota bacterium]|nr:hypothetical protein [Actinomycetota bacterium]